VAWVASLTGVDITLELARNVLRDIITEKDKVMGLDEIIKLVSEHYQLKVSELKSKKRTKNLVHPRQIGMYLCRTIGGASLPEVGRVFGGKDHTTVLHACRQVEDRKSKDIKYDAEVESLAKTIKGA
ncbi:MAG: helix-turn-helix domain-containing protein, partial [Nitrospirota bacterium]